MSNCKCEDCVGRRGAVDEAREGALYAAVVEVERVRLILESAWASGDRRAIGDALDALRVAVAELEVARGMRTAGGRP